MQKTGKYFITILLCGLIIVSAFSQQNSWRNSPDLLAIDSLENLLNKNIPDTTRLSVLTYLAIKHLDYKNKVSLEYAEEALKLTSKLGIEPDFQLFRILGNAYERTGDYEQAIEHIEKSISKLDPSEHLYIASANDYLAYLHLQNNVFYKAIDQYKSNLEYAKSYNLKQYETRSLAGLANVFNTIGDEEKEMYYLFQFLEKADNETQKMSIARAQFRVADNMRENFQYEVALKHYQKALVIAEELMDSVWMSSIINRIAWNFYVMGEMDSSLAYYNRSIIISLPINLRYNTANSYGNIGNIYRDKNDFEKAEFYYNKSIELAKQIDDLYNLSWVYEDMSEMKARDNKFDEAYNFYKLHTIYKDSMQTQTYESQLTEARARYEAEQREQDLELLNLKLKNNRFYTYVLSGGLILVLFIFLLLIRQNKLSTKQRLAAMGHKMSEMRQRNLRQQMNPHFIFNTLNSIQYYVFQNDKISSNTYMSKFASLIRKTLENSQHNSITIKEEMEALELYLELEAIRFKGKFDWEITIDSDIDTLTYKIPTMLIQPYVENSICHGLMHKDNGKGHININLNLGEDYISCTIDDNGIGRQKAMKIKNNKNNNHNSLGTSITESRLKLVNSIYGKKMKIQYIDKLDEEGEASGTKVIINIPIIN